MRRNRRREDLEVADSLRQLVSKINALRDTCVIVEGRSDMEALRAIGVTLPIIVYNSPGFKAAISRLEWSNVIILTDWDREGDEIYRRVRRVLEGLGYRVDEHFREEFRRLTMYMGSSVEAACKRLGEILRSVMG